MAPKSLVVSLSTFAQDHGLSLRRVQQWVGEGMPYRDVSGARMVVRSEANKWVRERERAEAVAAVTPADREEAEERKAMADAQLAELRLAREQGKVVPLEDTEQKVSALLEQLRSVLVTMPQRWAPRMTGLRSLAETTAVLEAAIEEALGALSDE